jgi:nitrate reductase cytochrome c-type subunit
MYVQMGLDQCVYCHRHVNRDVSGHKLQPQQRKQAEKYYGQSISPHQYICATCDRHPPQPSTIIAKVTYYCRIL